MNIKILNALIWKFLERGGVQAIQFIVSIIIARILAPSDYGAVALLTIFISIATIFVQSGLSTALIQKKDANEVDFSSVFYYSIFIATIVYAILFFFADSITVFYKIPELSKLMRVMALTLFPGAINAIQIAILSKKFQFKKQFYSSLVAVSISGVIGVTMAVLNWGAWALVWQQLSYQLIVCIVLTLFVKWYPKLQFSYQRTKSLLTYGLKLLLARLIDTIYHSLESLIIGKLYSAETLAYCNKGKQFSMTLIDNIDGAIQSVMLPAYSAKQENITEVKTLVRKSVSLSTFLVFPAMILLAAMGKPLILLMLGEKWFDSIIYLQLFCFVAMLFPLQTTCLQAINAMGRSDVFLRIMTIKRVLGVVVLFSAILVYDSPLSVVIAALLVEVIGVIINVIPNCKHLHYTLAEQVKDALPNLLLSAVVGVTVYLLSFVDMNDFLMLVLQGFLGVTLYFILSYIFKNPNLQYVMNNISKMFNNR